MNYNSVPLILLKYLELYLVLIKVLHPFHLYSQNLLKYLFSKLVSFLDFYSNFYNIHFLFINILLKGVFHFVNPGQKLVIRSQ